MIKDLKESLKLLKKSKWNILIEAGFIFVVFLLLLLFSNLFADFLGEINNFANMEDPFVALDAMKPVLNRLIMFFIGFFVVLFLLYCFVESLQWRWTYNLMKNKKGIFNKTYFFNFCLLNFVLLFLFYLLFLLLRISKSDIQIFIILFFGLILFNLLLIFYVLLNKKDLINVFKSTWEIIGRIHLFILMYLVISLVLFVGVLVIWLVGFLPGIWLGLILDLIVLSIVISLSRIFISLAQPQQPAY